MSKIELDREVKEILSRKIQTYFGRELDQEIGLFDAEFLLDFLAKELGPYLYNQGLQDAQAALQQQLENFNDAVYGLEQATESQG